MTARIQVRRGLSSAWAANDPVLESGEYGFESDTKAVKIGDGLTSWNSLPYLVKRWATYTPTLSQGAASDIAKTTNYSKYNEVGGHVFVQARLTPSGAGVAGSGIAVSLPTTAAAGAVGNVVGSGYYNDGGTQYQAVVYLATSTTVMLLSTHGTASASTDDPIGVNPNIAVAASDVINVSFSFEAA